ncbi:MAG: FAD:protein FMN transferase [Desulfofustis sp.]|jgi:thiamine biosynthesis lipoprotein
MESLLVRGINGGLPIISYNSALAAPGSTMNSSAVLASEQGFTRRRLLQLTAVSAAVGIIGYLGVRPRGRLKPVRHSQPMMGTIVNLVVCGEDEGSCRHGIEACIERMETLSMMMSTYVSDSPLSELNRFGTLNDAPQELVEVFKFAIELSELTDGAFDPTVLPLVGLFKEVRKTGKLPDQEKVKEILQVVDYRHIVVENNTTVKYSKPGVTATLDAVAKGYIVDRGIEVLQGLGFSNAFIEAGGDLMVVGHRYDGKPWKIGIRNPRSDDLKKMTTIEMSDRAIATSGDYMQYFTDDKKIHHIIDPRTGFSPVRTASSSIIAPTVAWADGLATAAMVLDPDQSIALLETLPDCEGYLIDKDMNRYQTKGFFS